MEKIIADKKPRVLVFDVYETLFDMGDVQRRMNQVTDSKRGYTIWFELFMQYCFANNSIDAFQDFFSIAKVSLQMAGDKLGRTITVDEANDILHILQHLPVREDVQSCLSELNDENYTIIALTNAPEKIVCDRMERTGLISYFENVFSAETVRKYKPEKKVYEWAAQKMNTGTDNMLMITSHSWDVAGANNAGMRTALIGGSKQAFYPLSIQPDISCKTLSELVKLLKEKD